MQAVQPRSGRYSMTVEFDCDPDNDDGPLSAIVAVEVGFYFTAECRPTWTDPGNPAFLEDLQLIEIHSVDVLIDGHPTPLKVAEWNDATKAAWRRYITSKMDLHSDRLKEAAWDRLDEIYGEGS